MNNFEKLLLVFGVIAGGIGVVAGTLTIIERMEARKKEVDPMYAYPAAELGPMITPVREGDQELLWFQTRRGKFGTIDQGV